MTDQAYDATLQKIVDEFRNICPEITEAFIFKKNGEFAAINKETDEDEAKKLIALFADIENQAQMLEGIETLSFQGAERQLKISATNNCCLATVSSVAADEKTVDALTRVIFPTVVELLDQIAPKNLGAELTEKIEVEKTVLPIKEEAVSFEEAQSQSGPEESASLTSEATFIQTQANQFMVEKIGGLLVASDVVRVDGDVAAKWSELYVNKQITHVHIETLEGKLATCKFKPIKEANQNAKGIIQIPEKILQALQTSKGKLVIVKPVVTLGRQDSEI